jgi:hypothetical protein
MHFQGFAFNLRFFRQMAVLYALQNGASAQRALRGAI